MFKKGLTVLLIAFVALTGVFAQGSQEQAAEELTTLRVAYMPNYASLCSVIAADELGAFAEEGLKIELIEFADGPTIINAMDGGSVDIGYIGHGAHKLCINGRAKIFAFSHVGNGDAVIGAKGIDSIEDLRGKKVGYASGSSSEVILTWALEEAGMTMDDIVAMEMDASAITTAMLSGSLDACALWSPATFTILEGMKDAKVLANNVTFSDRSASVASWIVTSKWAEQNRDLLVRFNRALNKGVDYRADEKNYRQVSEWVAAKLGADVDVVYQQRGDAEWLTSAEVLKQIEDGTIEKLYEVQKKSFGDLVDQNTAVSDYVLFDIMKESAR